MGSGVSLAEFLGQYVPTPYTIVKWLHIIRKIHDTLKPFDILNQEIDIRVPELTGEYSIALKISHKEVGKFFPLSYPVASISRITVHTLDFFRPIENFFVNINEDWKSDTSKLPDGIDKLLITFEFKIPEANFLNNLVQRDRAREVIGEELSEYWLNAQLKHPAVLKTVYGRLDLHDVPFNVNVGVAQEIRDIIPREFVKSLETQQELSKTRDREERLRLSLEMARQRTRYTGREYSFFSDMQDLFFPTRFAKFIKVTPPFYYDTCVRGRDFYDLTFPTFPKSMEVISRTNLTLENPAAHGKLVYSKRDFMADVKKIFGIE